MEVEEAAGLSLVGRTAFLRRAPPHSAGSGLRPSIEAKRGEAKQSKAKQSKEKRTLQHFQ